MLQECHVRIRSFVIMTLAGCMAEFLVILSILSAYIGSRPFFSLLFLADSDWFIVKPDTLSSLPRFASVPMTVLPFLPY